LVIYFSLFLFVELNVAPLLFWRASLFGVFSIFRASNLPSRNATLGLPPFSYRERPSKRARVPPPVGIEERRFFANVVDDSEGFAPFVLKKEGPGKEEGAEARDDVFA